MTTSPGPTHPATETQARLEDLEDSLALALLELRRANGEQPALISNEAARRIFVEAAGPGE
ncbi:hypothetical protein SRB5_31830 [Streptomyces sp. RB5]|uniref:Uncharacterized protein n=1 Tax=Streptomyces smaragdinus TaxID=2585196 RepID=A0A7K0CI75_9ACTN|nr:hypothetical protein [Streptomyces smaragdinus]MQY13043.1 hypothetical protein [Streptomyces smaragdinus]